MLINISATKGYAIAASDGEIGHVENEATTEFDRDYEKQFHSHGNIDPDAQVAHRSTSA